MKDLAQGLGAWALVLALLAVLPGRPWRAGPAPPPPWEALTPAALLGGLLVLAAGLAVRLGGPRSGQLLALWEALPVVLWGALLLACWPAAWGPPGWSGLGLAWLAALLPGEIRWLGAALPPEHPLPAAYGPRAVGRTRTLALRRVLPGWLGARLPMWIGAMLVLELMLGLRGPGGDWMTRLALRDRPGLAIWIAGYAGLWLLGRR